MTEPAPLVPPEVDLGGMPFMPLDVQRLLDSELWLTGTGEECKAAVTLWCKAWQQRPAASLPDNDKLLAAYSGAGARWERVRAQALHGFVKCSDGRLYHPVIADKALEAWEKRQSFRNRTKAANDKRRQLREQRQHQRDDQRDVRRDIQRNEPRDNVVDIQRDEERNIERRANVTSSKDSDSDRDSTPKPPSSRAPPRPNGPAGAAYRDIPWSERGPAKSDPDGAHAAWSFHKAREVHFGTAPPSKLAAKEIAICQGWVDRGVTYDRLREVFDDGIGRRAKLLLEEPFAVQFFAEQIERLIGTAA